LSSVARVHCVGSETTNNQTVLVTGWLSVS
jgi:hypothetical protein